jgi:hypothetical protein
MSPPKLTARAGEAGPDLPGWRAARPGGGAGLRPAAALPLSLLGLHGQLVTGRDGGGHDPGRHRDPGQPDTANQDRAHSLQQGSDGQGAGAEHRQGDHSIQEPASGHRGANMEQGQGPGDAARRS